MTAPRKPAKPSWVRSAGKMLRRAAPPPPEYVVVGLVFKGGITMLVGPAKGGKTLFALGDLVLAMLGLRKALGRFEAPEPQRVLYVAEESSEAAFYWTLFHLCQGYGIDHKDPAFNNLFFAAQEGVNLLEDGWITKLKQKIDQHRIDVVFFDTYTRVTPGMDEDSRATTSLLFAALGQLQRDIDRDMNCTFVVLHHVGHEGTRARGSSDIEAAWDSRVTIAGDTGGTEYTLKSVHRAFGRRVSMKFQIVGEDAEPGKSGWVRLDAQELEEQQDEVVEAVHRWVHANPGRGSKEIVAGVKKKRQSVLDALKVLKGDCLVERQTAVPDGSGGKRPGTSSEKSGTDGNEKWPQGYFSLIGPDDLAVPDVLEPSGTKRSQAPVVPGFPPPKGGTTGTGRGAKPKRTRRKA